MRALTEATKTKTAKSFEIVELLLKAKAEDNSKDEVGGWEGCCRLFVVGDTSGCTDTSDGHLHTAAVKNKGEGDCESEDEWKRARDDEG